MPPKILIIHGSMASGKSTISSELNKKLKNFILIDRAYLKDTMLREVKAKNPELAKQTSKEAMYLIAKKLMKHKYLLINFINYLI